MWLMIPGTEEFISQLEAVVRPSSIAVSAASSCGTPSPSWAVSPCVP